jgi:hypothetical protein
MFNKVIIIGDSFCFDRTDTNTDWPLILSKKLNVPLYGKGFAGQSFWPCRNWINDIQNRKFFNNNKSLLIVCHTEYSRLPSNENVPLNLSVLQHEFEDDVQRDAATKIKNMFGNFKDNSNELVKSKIDIISDNLLLRAQKTKNLLKEFYLSELYVNEFYNWAQQAWIKELNSMSPEFYKIMHIKGFDMTEVIPENNSVLIDIEEFKSLRNLSEQELINPNYSGMDRRRNHFKDNNNIVLAEKLAKIIQDMLEDFTGKISLNVRPEWDFEKINYINSRD